MRVLYLTLNDKGGMIHYVSQLLDALPSEVDPLLISGVLEKENALRKKQCVHCFSLKFRDIPFCYFKIQEIITFYNPDLVHITSAHYLIYLIYPIIKKYPIALTLHDVTPHTGENNLITSAIIKKHKGIADHIFVHGSALKSQLLDMGYPQQKISVIPLGDFSFFLNYKLDDICEEDATILFFGRIEEYKGLKYLIESMPYVQREVPNAKLIIAGRGDLNNYSYLLQNKEVFEVHNCFITDPEVAPLFQRAKVVVLPYIDGTQTGVVPIAYAFQKPVVVTDVGSIPEVVEVEKTGLVIPPKDPLALANAIIFLLKNENLRRKMGNNGYQKMKKELSWNVVMKETLAVYKMLIKKTNRIK